MRAALLILPLAACASPPVGSDAVGPLAAVAGYTGSFGPQNELRVRRNAPPFSYDEGAEAKRAAQALCRGAVASGPEDNFREGQWIFPGGCA
ncbi:hypothetical protein [Rhodobacter maris]|uniref:Uncharacterized protein n=1 Tax=Rhodobacter maris TaxID=446682 RepID=A0A285SPZ6_9RHOB|nr:hypothetical protein [Rhodobacter maris]SOC10310.1 hypothetical protein SAMN05877831_10845 [Rhodobacter maris]